jgi:hypothetical protein
LVLHRKQSLELPNSVVSDVNHLSTKYGCSVTKSKLTDHSFSQRVEDNAFYLRQLEKGGSASPEMPVRLGPMANTIAKGERLTYSLFFFAIGDLESTI